MGKHDKPEKDKTDREKAVDKFEEDVSKTETDYKVNIRKDQGTGKHRG